MTLFQAALLSVFPALMIFAALSDATTYTIPNRISLLLLAVFFPTAFALGRPLDEIGVDLAIGVVALITAMGMFAAGWIGGGDAKLFAVAGLWLGWSGAPMFLLATALSGGALAVMLMNARAAWLRPYFTAAPPWLARLVAPDAAVPYGVAIAIGGLAAFPHCALVESFHGSF
jgi:prepilin peptidase CpaA